MSARDTPEVRQGRGSPAPLPGKCGGKLTRTDPPRYCKMSPLTGRTRCKLHGGRSVSGMDHPNFKTGQRSIHAWLHPKVAVAYEAALADERLMDLTGDVALLEVLKRDEAAEWTAGASPEAWQALGAALQAAQGARSLKAMRARLGDAVRAWQASSADAGLQAAARERVAAAVERKGRLVTTQQRLMVDTEDLIPATRVRTFIRIISDLAREFIPDDQRKAEFGRRFIGAMGARLRPAAVAGSPAGVVVDAEPAGKP